MLVPRRVVGSSSHRNPLSTNNLTGTLDMAHHACSLAGVCQMRAKLLHMKSKGIKTFQVQNDFVSSFL